MEVLLFCVALLSLSQAQYLPLSSPSCQQVVSPCQQVVSPCQQVVSPCQSPSPVVATTIVDNSVSNSLANAIQLLIVSNLIENTMKSSCGCGLSLPGVPSICDCGPSVYPAIEVLPPPCIPFDPISPCDIIAPCDPIIEVIPNGCYPEVLPVLPNACYQDILPVPNVGCGCGCDGPFMPNFGPKFGPNCGCGNGFPSLKSILPSLLPNLGLPNIGMPNIGLPNIGCGCKGPYGPVFGYDEYGPMIPDGCPGYNNYGYGVPNYPMDVEYGYDPCPNRCYGNGPYYY